MRHGKKINHLSRKAAHRKSLLSNMAGQLIIHKRIKTTVAKAKALRKYVEPLITKAKNDTTHSRRIVFGYLGHKEPVKELFVTVADKIGDRPGGYTRIIKLGNRLGDNAEMAMIELVDFNELLLEDKKKGKGKRKRTRRAGKAASTDTNQEAKTDEKTETAQKEEPKAEEAKSEDVATEEKSESTTETKEKASETKGEEKKKAETSEKPEAENKDTGKKEDDNKDKNG